MNVFTDIAVSGYLPQRSLAGFPKLEKKKPKTAKVYTNTSDGAQPSSVQSNICQTNEVKIP